MANEAWKSAEAAETYEQMADLVAPGRREILDIIARLAINNNPDNNRFLDLGCGRGELTAELLKFQPEARITMIDFSEYMVESSRERFKSFPGVKVIQYDLNQGLPDLETETYHAVVSCFALHHVLPEARIQLYKNIKFCLNKQGIFINGDLFKGCSPAVHDWEFDNYIQWVVNRLRDILDEEHSFAEIKARQIENYRQMGDQPGTLWDSYRDLMKAGFRYADCLYKNQNLAVICASQV